MGCSGPLNTLGRNGNLVAIDLKNGVIIVQMIESELLSKSRDYRICQWEGSRKNKARAG